MKPEELMAQAMLAMEKAYAPYSKFQVGAALLGADGQVYTGCNVENASYGATVCAERAAFMKWATGGREQPVAMVIVGGRDGVVTDFAPPCGICRQVMMEFCDPKTFQIILAVDKETYKIMTLEELLPMGFGPANLA